MTLSEMKKGQKAVVTGFHETSDFDASLVFDQGIYEGAEIIVCNLAPLGKDPMAIEVNGSKLAVRRALASFIKVDLIRP